MLHGGGPKGSNIDPRSGKARQESMLSGRRRGGGPRRRWLMGTVAAAVVIVIAVVVALRLTGNGNEPSVDTADPDIRSTIGLLNCSPGVVAERVLPVDGRSPREMLQTMEPAVVSVAHDPVSSDRVWGYDAADRIVAGIAESDLAEEYTVYTCSG